MGRTIVKQPPDEAYKLYQRTVALVAEQRYVFVELGEVLKNIRDNEIFRQFGEGGYDTWEQFLADPAISMPVSTAGLYIRVYEYYVLNLKMTKEEVIELPLGRLMNMMPLLKGKPVEEAKKVVDKMRGLSHSDFVKEMADSGFLMPGPKVFKDKETGKWVIELHPELVTKIIVKCADPTQGMELVRPLLHFTQDKS